MFPMHFVSLIMFLKSLVYCENVSIYFRAFLCVCECLCKCVLSGVFTMATR